MAHGTSAREVVEALKDVDFPATKDELVEAARRTGGGSKEVVAALRAIPPDEYANKDEVARSVRVDPASDLDRAGLRRPAPAPAGPASAAG
ncbi:DUF2795 domain-containing protein, partial [Streptomyces nigra]